MNLTKLISACVCLAISGFAAAAGQSSTNFTMQRDAINAGIGTLSSSNFVLSSSVGEATQRGTLVGGATAPGTPTITSTAAGNGRAVITFTPPLSDGGAPITTYTATCVASGQVTRSTAGSGSPLTVGGLTSGVVYTCSVTATNAAGLTSGGSASLPVIPAPALSDITPLLMLLLLACLSASRTQRGSVVRVQGEMEKREVKTVALQTTAQVISAANFMHYFMVDQLFQQRERCIPVHSAQACLMPGHARR